MDPFPSNARGFLTTWGYPNHCRSGFLPRSLLLAGPAASMVGHMAGPPAAHRHEPSPTPTDRLMALLRRRHWEAALERLLQHPLDARFRDTPGRATPLHAALMHRAPHPVVALLVEAFPAALLLQDTEGWAPLHVHILYGGPEETTLLLVRRGGPAAAALQGRLVGAPLHLLCRHGPPSLAALRALAAVRPDQVTAPNEVGMAPVDLLYKSFQRRRDGNGDGDVAGLVRQLLVLVEAVYPADADTANRNAQEPSLHQVVLFQSQHAREADLVGLVLREHPHLARSRDRRGRLPLHVAAAQAAPVPPAPPASPFHSGPAVAPCDALLRLLAAHPAAAAEPDPVTGRVPLHAALAAAAPGAGGLGAGPLGALLRAHPAALQEADPLTGLYPYQLAATATGGRCQAASSGLDTVFGLLKACPSVLVAEC